jgi:hypothetical protein
MENEMQTEPIDNERERAWQAALKRFDEAARRSIRRRPRMMAIQVNDRMALAIERNPASLTPQRIPREWL